MARKTRKDKLRSTKKRQRTLRRLARIGLVVAVIAGVLAVAAYGAWKVPEVQSFVKSVLRGGKAGAYEYSSSYRQVVLGEKFDFAGGKMTVDQIRTTPTLRSAFGGGTGNEPAQVFKAKNGAWLLVMVTFQGSKYAEAGTMNPNSAVVIDEDGNIYKNHGSGSPAEDLYFETSTTAFGKLALTNPHPQKAPLIFDLSRNARGLILAFLWSEDGQEKVFRAAKLSIKGSGR